MPTHDSMQEIHLIDIKYLTLSMLNQQWHVNHRLPIPYLHGQFGKK